MDKTRVRLAITIVLLLSGNGLLAVCFPQNGAVLNYRSVYFGQSGTKPSHYVLKIAKGAYDNQAEFDRHIIVEKPFSGAGVVADVPEFGTEYTWCIVGDKSSATIAINLNHFRVVAITNPLITTNRIRVVHEATAYKSGYFFSDLQRAIYDMAGNMVWSLPEIKGYINEQSEVRDLKMTPQGTITCIAKTDSKDRALEFSYSGKLLWCAPDNGKVSTDTIEHYHHAFTRLTNGSYMVLGSEIGYWGWHISNGTDSTWAPIDKKTPSPAAAPGATKMTFCTLIEYDNSGKVIWSWKYSNYYKKMVQKDRRYITQLPDLHENGFAINERDKTIYLSFRDNSEILKIGYPKGEVLADYGYPFAAPGRDALFCEQHGLGATKKGFFFLFNNNMCNLDDVPAILILKEPQGPAESLEKVWEYPCPIDMNGVRRPPVANWGNVIELPDESFFVSMGLPYGHIFIVDKDKSLLWDAVLEHWNPGANTWDEVSQYRCNFITDRKAFEKMVMSGFEIGKPSPGKP